MDMLKLGIVGLGEFAIQHLEILSRLPNVEVVGLVSRSEERARELADTYGVAGVFSSTAEMIEGTEVAAVDVITEDKRHHEPVMTALEAGKDVFVEKPLSDSLAEAEEMVEKAAATGRKMMVGHVLRFDPRMVTAKEKVASGEFGRLSTVFGRRNMCKSFLEQYSKANRLFTTGIHDIDLILWLYEGREPVEVYMKTQEVIGPGEDVFWGLITMEDGSLGIVETNWLLPEKTTWRGDISLEIIGDRGALQCQIPPRDGFVVWTDEEADIPEMNWVPEVQGVPIGALATELRYFVRCLLEDQPIEQPQHDEVLRTLRVAHALVQSAAEGRPVQL